MFPGSQVSLLNFCVSPILHPDSRVAANSGTVKPDNLLGGRAVFYFSITAELGTSILAFHYVPRRNSSFHRKWDTFHVTLCGI